MKNAWKTLKNAQLGIKDMAPFDKLNESFGKWGEIIKALFGFGILLLLGPGLVIVNVSEIINQGEEFTLWFGEYGPDHPEFAGEVIWEGTTGETWTVELIDEPADIRVWVQEGKTVDVSVPRSGASFERCDPSECDYFNNANESIPEYEFVGQINVYINNTYDVQFTSTGEIDETTSIIVTKEEFPEAGAALIFMTFVGTVITFLMIFIAYQAIKDMRGEAGNNNGSQESVSENNWIGPDGVESGPGVSEDWYLTYNGPAPVVEDIYDENYAVDRGNGVVPIHFYIKKWGIPEGFGKTDHEKLWSIE